jgi:hypothetical protein
MEDKKIIIEELSRIKNLMVYDRSKTLNENINEDGTADMVDKVYRWLLPSGDIVDGSDIKGKIPAGSKLLNADNAEKAIEIAGGLNTASSLLGGGGATAAATGAAEVGAGAVAAEVGAGAVGAAGAAGAVGAEGAAAATFLGLGPVGWIVIGVAGIAALGYWAATKDDKMGMIENLFGIS